MAEFGHDASTHRNGSLHGRLGRLGRLGKLWPAHGRTVGLAYSADEIHHPTAPTIDRSFRQWCPDPDDNGPNEYCKAIDIYLGHFEASA